MSQIKTPGMVMFLTCFSFWHKRQTPIISMWLYCAYLKVNMVLYVTGMILQAKSPEKIYLLQSSSSDPSVQSGLLSQTRLETIQLPSLHTKSVASGQEPGCVPPEIQTLCKYRYINNCTTSLVVKTLY